MRRTPRFLSDVRGAWETLADIPLPESFPGGGAAADGRMLLWFPLLGAFCGAAIAALGKLAALLTNQVAGATVFAFAGLAFLILKDSGRGIVLLISLLDRRLDAGSFAKALSGVSSDRSVLSEVRFGVPVASALAIVEFVALFLMGLHGSGYFLVAVLTGSFTVQGGLAAGFPERDSRLVPDEDGAGCRRMFFAAAVIAAFSLWRFPVATAFSVALCCLMIFGYSGVVRREVEAATPELITLAGALTEAGLLLCGFLWTL